MTKTKETLESFAARCLAQTGVALNNLPRRVARDGDTMGHIFCARGYDYVCAVGYPSHEDEETGEQIFNEFELVLARSRP